MADIINNTADFSPALGEYKTLQPFKYWCQKVLPLVYDESLSYYELLCKVVDYLNKSMEDVETLHDDVVNLHGAYEDLEDYTNDTFNDIQGYITTNLASIRAEYAQLVSYVNNYFTNLDVQNEINTKLDEMATSGALSTLLAPFIPSLVSAWLTEHITPTSPAVDNTLTISGAAADAKVTGDKITEINATLSDIENNVNLVDPSTMVSKIISDSGEYYSSSNYRTVIVPVKGGRKYKILNPNGNRLYIGSSNSLAATQTLTDFVKFTTNVHEGIFTTGANSTYMFINFYNASISGDGESTAVNNLTAVEITAKDQIARDEIEIVDNKLPTKAPITALTALNPSKNLYNYSEHYHAGYYINNNGAWGGPGDPDWDVIGYIPVSELSKVTVMIENANATALTASGQYAFYNANKTAIGTKQGLDRFYGNYNAFTLTVPENAAYLAFNLYKTYAKYVDSKPVIMVESGDAYTGVEEYGTYMPKHLAPKDIYVCAKDSPDKYRIGCDFFCDGINDELTLQTALDAVGNVGTLWLAPGIYNIDSIPLQSDGQYVALQYKTLLNETANEKRVRIRCYDQTPMRENGYSDISRCAVLRVRSTCYENLDSDTQYSIIGVEKNTTTNDRVWNGTCFDVSGIGIEIPGNQKKVIAFDAWYAFCIMMERCMATAIPTNAMPSVAGNEDCIGIKCTKGSNFGQCSQLVSCAMYGFGQGIAVSGEHYVLINCKTIYNKYGFTFNWYGDNNAGYTHPNTLINCCSEMDFNYPYFGYNGQVSSVTLIDFNMEYRNASAALGGELAQERVPGSWRGSINYTIKTYGSDGYDSGNNVTFPFWKEGHGTNVKTINDAQKQLVTTNERNRYAPNEMQRVYDITENKFYTYVNGAWVEG